MSMENIAGKNRPVATNFQFLKIFCPSGTSLLKLCRVSEVLLLGRACPKPCLVVTIIRHTNCNQNKQADRRSQSILQIIWTIFDRFPNCEKQRKHKDKGENPPDFHKDTHNQKIHLLCLRYHSLLPVSVYLP